MLVDGRDGCRLMGGICFSGNGRYPLSEGTHKGKSDCNNE